MAEISIGDLISGGGTLVFAFVVWTEVRAVRLVLTGMAKSIVQLEERTRHMPVPTNSTDTPAHGFNRPDTQ